MPLSDDELLGIERITTALRDYLGPEDGGVMVSKGIIDHELGRVPELIAELRAARKVVEAAKGVANNPDTWGWDYDVPSHARLRDALAEYDTANAEPQEQPA